MFCTHYTIAVREMQAFFERLFFLNVLL